MGRLSRSKVRPEALARLEALAGWKTVISGFSEARMQRCITHSVALLSSVFFLKRPELIKLT